MDGREKRSADCVYNQEFRIYIAKYIDTAKHSYSCFHHFTIFDKSQLP